MEKNKGRKPKGRKNHLFLEGLLKKETARGTGIFRKRREF